MESRIPVDACDLSILFSGSKADEFLAYERNQKQINKCEDMAAIGCLEEVLLSHTRGECTEGDCNHTILGTVYSYNAHSQHLYLHQKPFQHIPCVSEKKNNPYIQLSVGSPYEHFIGYLEILVDPGCQTYEAPKDENGWYLKVQPQTKVIERMMGCLARPSTIRVDIPNTYAKFNRRRACLSRFYKNTDDPLPNLVTREIFAPNEFETLNQCFNFSLEEVRSAVAEVSRDLSLNDSQHQAIEKALHSRLHCIQGPPGTGKTQTLVGLTACFLKLFATRDADRSLICVAGPSNDTVDDLDAKLLDQVSPNLLRIGKPTPKLQDRLHAKTTNTAHWLCKIPDEHLAEKMSTAQILSGTTSAFGNEQTTGTKRDVLAVFIDEAGRDSELDTIQVLDKLDKAGQCILIGDPRQLPPCIQSQVAIRLGGATPLMCRLENQPGKHVKPWQASK